MNTIVAADVGKRFDQSAVAVVERTSPEPPHTDASKWHTSWKVPSRESIYLVRELGRLPMGMSYTDQAYHLAEACHNVRCFDPDGSLTFLLDATGVGEGVADLLQRYLPTDVKLQKAWFTSTERMERVRGEIRVGKPWMISRLTSLIETGRVRFGDVPLRLDLVEELQAFEYRITASGNFTADARSGSHDDLITCLGLATMLDGGGAGPRYSGRPLDSPPRLPPDTDDWTTLHSQSGW